MINAIFKGRPTEHFPKLVWRGVGEMVGRTITQGIILPKQLNPGRKGALDHKNTCAVNI